MGLGEKRNIELLFGLAQVINLTTITQLNITRGITDGYLTDPYKIVTVVDPTSAPVDSLFESRPISRSRNAVFWRTAHHFTEDVVHFSFRYAWDDWGIDSYTADLNYRYELFRNIIYRRICDITNRPPPISINSAWHRGRRLRNS